MRKIKLLLGILVFTSAVLPAASDSMFTGSFGVNIFTYNTVYLTTGATYQHSLREAMDIVYGADFGINTVEEGDEVKANFLVPAKLGLYFPFGGEKITYGLGTGISPCFTFGSTNEDPGFLMGPYLNGSVRIQVHPVMSVFFQVQQDLLFGAPEWIYTGTRFQLGISF